MTKRRMENIARRIGIGMEFAISKLNELFDWNIEKLNKGLMERKVGGKQREGES